MGIGKGEVLQDRAVQERVLLREQNHLLAQALQADVLAAERAVVNRAALQGVQPGDDLAQGALAAAGFTDQGRGQPTGDAQVEMVKQGRASRVVEAHLFTHDVGIGGDPGLLRSPGGFGFQGVLQSIVKPGHHHP